MWWIKILLFLPCWVIAQNYCSISQHHTMCKYKESGPTCGSNKESGVSKAEIQEILKLHNGFRSKIAMGMEHRGYPGPQPPAANMQQLVWDHNLAAVAQKWADQCLFQHDACRDDPRFQVGQNMYFSSGFSKVDWTRAISSWYEEVRRFNSQTVDSFQFQPTVGHYTQLIWGNTRYVGCGRVAYGGAYRLEGYQRMEYVLSASPRNQSVVDTEDKNRRRTDILPDLDDIRSTITDTVEDSEHVAKTLFTTAQASDEDNSKESTTTISTKEVFLTTSKIIEKQTIILPSTTTQALDENDFQTSTTETFMDKIISTTAGIEEEKLTLPPTTTQVPENNSFKQSALETSTEKGISVTSEIKEERTTKPCITNQASKENKLGETTTKHFTENDQLASKHSKIPKTKNSSSQNPSFTIYIPGYWIGKSDYNPNGRLAGTFQSLEFSKSADLNSFIHETPPTGALEIASWDSAHGNWNLNSNRAPPSFAAEDPARIQISRLTQTGWIQSSYDKLGRDQILICNYGPAGNYLYQPIYVRGQPCSKCPLGSVCENGLCV